MHIKSDYVNGGIKKLLICVTVMNLNQLKRLLSSTIFLIAHAEVCSVEIEGIQLVCDMQLK